MDLLSTCSVETKQCFEQLKALVRQNNNNVDVESFISLLSDDDDYTLLQFCRGKKNDVQDAYEHLKRVVRVRIHEYPDITASMLPSKVPLLQKGYSKVLQKLDPQGRVVHVCTPSLWEPELYPVEDVIRASTLVGDYIFREYPTCCEEGVVIILNCAGISFKHAKGITPSYARMSSTFTTTTPVRMKAIHIVQLDGVVLNLCLKMARLFLKKKLRDRIFVHSGNLNSLHEQIPKSMLPLSLGGDLPEEEAYDQKVVPKLMEAEERYEQVIRSLPSMQK